MSENTITLTADSVRYFSENDESAFFEWLENLSFIKSINGHGRELLINTSTDLTEYDIRELLALFHRYDISMGQLRLLFPHDMPAWFKDEKAYWHAKVFAADQY